MPPPTGGGRTLSRDFKDVRRHRPVAVGHGFNGWVGLGVGLTLGLSVALGVHLYDRQQPATAAAEPVPAKDQAPASEVASDDAAVSSASTPDTAGPELDFYDVLPRQEVEVAGKSATATTAAKTPLPTGDAILQAGSFKQSTEAEKMQAQLALLGISSKIQRASVDDETWYRVRIGPIETVEELRVIQAKLREAEINAPAVAPVEEAPLP
ncbi:MAG TPA: SPOR domain-containing protein [Steroidobacteraceae bacterium]